MGTISMKKRRNKKGYTLIELLCTLAVILLVGTVAVNCLQLGVEAYGKLMRESEAQLLCSTLTTSVSEELRYARSASGSTFVDSHGHDSSYTRDANGHVLLNDDPVLSERSYPLGLEANVALDYDSTAKLITAVITVSFQGEELTTNEFAVTPVNLAA